MMLKKTIAHVLSEGIRHVGLPPWLSSKESACNAGDTGDVSSIPGLGRSEGHHSSRSIILAWRIPWMEELGRLQSKGSQRFAHD